MSFVPLDHPFVSACYEVSEDVAVEFKREFCGQEEEILMDKGNGKVSAGFMESERVNFIRGGVKRNIWQLRISVPVVNDKLLFSHRAKSGKNGENLGAFLSIREE